MPDPSTFHPAELQAQPAAIRELMNVRHYPGHRVIVWAAPGRAVVSWRIDPTDRSNGDVLVGVTTVGDEPMAFDGNGPVGLAGLVMA